MKYTSLLYILMLLLTLGAAQPVEEFRAVKLTNVDSNVLFSDKSIASAMDYLASIGINTVITVVWNGHGADGVYTIYPSAVMDSLFGQAMIPTFDQNRDPLERVIIEAHRNGIEVLPWFEMGFSCSYSQNGGHILNRFPEWGLKNNQGQLVVKNGFDWMSGINPGVQKLISDLALEIADKYDIDGIEFSDRIPAMPVSGGYDSATVAIYRSEHGGSDPPQDSLNPSWMRWRADKLSDFNRMVRDSLKARSPHLLFSSSPSVFPWSYDEYLQDSKTWVDSGIVDNIIPQLYRYNISSYILELDRSLSFIPQNKRDIFFAGVLMNVGSYTISPEFLLQSLQANRQRNVQGEGFFFYEGLRKNGNLLGDTLRATYYAHPALLPHRNGEVWRPPATIVNEDDPGAIISGNWTVSTIPGFRGNILLNQDNQDASISYYMEVPAEGWYDVFPYVVTGPLATTQARYTVYSLQDSTEIIFDQTDYYQAGWQPLHTAYLAEGYHKVIKVDNQLVNQGEILTADAAMIMINRKLSPDVVFTTIEQTSRQQPLSLQDFELYQNYPNPFNSTTRIPFRLATSGQVRLRLYDILGRVAYQTGPGNYPAGYHQLSVNSEDLSSGIYFYHLEVSYPHHDASVQKVKKLILLK